MKKNLCLLFWILIGLFQINSSLINAQSPSIITGTVIDESGEPLIGASILIKGTAKGTVTDIDGSFKIEVDSGAYVLVISYTGFDTKEINVQTTTSKDSDLLMTLDSEGVELAEVVVTVLGVKKEKKSIGYAISTISMGKGSRADTYSSSKKRKSKSKRKKNMSAPVMAMDGIKPSSFESAAVAADYSSNNAISAGLLTAGEIHDFNKWELWEDIAKEDLSAWKNHWKIEPLERYAVQAMTEEGHPIVDAEVQLLAKNEEIIWETRTDNTGKAELWANIFTEDGNEQPKEIKLIVRGKSFSLNTLSKFQEGINVFKINQTCDISQTVDLLFVVDATSSMSDELAYLKMELNDIIGKAKKEHEEMDFNLGSIFYRDKGDQYITRKSDFSDNIKQTIDFIGNQSAAGGGDVPEAVDSALHVAIHEMSWAENSVARLLFLILDAPPHSDENSVKKMSELAKEAAKKGIKIIPITASGIDKSGEYLMRSLALATNGTYTFLTNHSGIGNDHIEPSTDEYEVETLNDLLIRLINQFTQTTNCQELPAFANNILEQGNNQQNLNNNPDSTANSTFKIKYYPNPTTGLLTLELEQDFQELFVTDLSGKILQRHQNLMTGNRRIDLSNFASGVYFLKYEVEGKPKAEKVFVIH